jgi:predicted transport protein
MPLFDIKGDQASPVTQVEFQTEKVLQGLVEKNLKAIFNCSFVATEFKTGLVHNGRIDTLALSEDGNPVIIEYKKVASGEVVLQALYYLHWLKDHHGDFELAVQKALGSAISIDWSDIRVICLAPSYKKFDQHAVQAMGANIELWTYRKYSNGSVFFEEAFRGSPMLPSETSTDDKNPVMVEAGKKAALTKAQGGWTFEQHLEGKSEDIKELVLAAQEFILALDTAIEEAPKKLYVAYRTTQNIVCMEVQKQKILFFLKLDPGKHPGPPGISRDMRQIGHFGTGDLEVTVKTAADFELLKPYIQKAYEQVGG